MESPIVSAAEMRAAEEAAFARGIEVESLMDQAGAGVAHTVRKFFPRSCQPGAPFGQRGGHFPRQIGAALQQAAKGLGVQPVALDLGQRDHGRGTRRTGQQRHFAEEFPRAEASDLAMHGLIASTDADAAAANDI